MIRKGASFLGRSQVRNSLQLPTLLPLLEPSLGKAVRLSTKNTWDGPPIVAALLLQNSSHGVKILYRAASHHYVGDSI